MYSDKISHRGHYAGVGGSGFQSFFLKEEIMKAISECGFEHPSEGIFLFCAYFSSSKPMYSESAYARRYFVPGTVRHGKDVRLCDFRVAKHQAL